MIVDSSAIVAILLGEPEATLIASTIISAVDPCISAPSWLEVTLVADNHENPELRQKFDRLIKRLGVRVVPFDGDMAKLARQAHQQFGRGNHPTRLNFGDCFSYALAKHAKQPLLFKGKDFSQTDITAALS